MKTKLKALAVVGIIGVLAGCTPIFDDTVPVQENGSTTPSVQTTNTITIGALLPLTGEKAAIGNTIKQSMQLALENANTGSSSTKFAIEFSDDACNEETAKTAMNDLITTKKVKVVIGGVCDTATLAASQIAEQNKVVFFSPSNGNPALTTAGDFVFRNYPSDIAIGQLLADTAVKANYKKVFVLAEEGPHAKTISSAFPADNTVSLKSDASDLADAILKLKAATPDVILLNLESPANFTTVLTKFDEAGIKGPYLLNDVAFRNSDAAIKPNSKFLADSQVVDTNYEKLLDSLSHDAVLIIKEAIDKVGEEPGKIKDYLYTIKGRQGLSTTLSFDANGDPTDQMYAVRQIAEDGTTK